MNSNKYKRFTSSLTIGGLLLLGLFLWLNGSPSIVRADPGDLFVTPGGSGTDCTQATPCDLPAALGQSTNGDTIYLAGGTYTGSGAAVLTVTQSITLYGGWDGATTTPPACDPDAKPTTLNGEGARRVVYISGDITPTLEGLRITNGSVSGDGGGVYVSSAHPIIGGCRIYSNTATGHGGGIRLSNSEGVALTDNLFHHNVAGQDGGGLYLNESDGALLVNNVVSENQLSNPGGLGTGVRVYESTVRFLHTTLARNSGGQGHGIYATPTSTLWLTNTILVSHTTGIYVNTGNTVTLESTLWGDGSWANGTDTAGPGTINTSNDYTGDPDFISPNDGDYHIASHSAAVGQGVDSGVSDDIDGDPRPFCESSDLGADESPCCVSLNGDTYFDVQAAVDASSSSSDVVKVTGVCRGVRTRGFLQQIAYVTKTLTIRGGYSDAFTEPPDPDAHPTTLDAARQGAVVYISGDITPTLEGLRLTNGSANGIRVQDAHPIISGCHIFDNIGGFSGGIDCWNCDNTRLIGNEIYDNTAFQSGGGVLFFSSNNVTLTGNDIYSNTAEFVGGGAYLARNSDLTLLDNEIYNNTAGWEGGGLFLSECGNTTLVNNMVLENQINATDDGAGVYLEDTTAHFLHTTLARNRGGNEQGIYVTDSSAGSSLWMTNTILVGHIVGIKVTGGNTATLEATLWGAGAWANVTDTTGSGTIATGAINLWGDPAFVNPDGGDYHIGSNSEAIDEGVDAGVNHDIDDDPRPNGPGYDIGADEYYKVLHNIYLPLVLRNV